MYATTVTKVVVDAIVVVYDCNLLRTSENN